MNRHVVDEEDSGVQDVTLKVRCHLRRGEVAVDMNVFIVHGGMHGVSCQPKQAGHAGQQEGKAERNTTVD